VIEKAVLYYDSNPNAAVLSGARSDL